jgi:hypothetical protein
MRAGPWHRTGHLRTGPLGLVDDERLLRAERIPHGVGPTSAAVASRVTGHRPDDGVAASVQGRAAGNLRTVTQCPFTSLATNAWMWFWWSV